VAAWDGDQCHGVEAVADALERLVETVHTGVGAVARKLALEMGVPPRAATITGWVVSNVASRTSGGGGRPGRQGVDHDERDRWSEVIGAALSRVCTSSALPGSSAWAAGAADRARPEPGERAVAGRRSEPRHVVAAPQRQGGKDPPGTPRRARMRPGGRHPFALPPTYGLTGGGDRVVVIERLLTAAVMTRARAPARWT
jgi:hypothetical protein